MDPITQNRTAWNERVQEGTNRWTLPVTAAQIAAARQGVWEIHLTPLPVPKAWLGDVAGASILCLASGGGQQGPILAAAGAKVTVFDLSDAQLQQDRFVAQRDGLAIKTVQGDMRDLSAFADATFDIIVQPVATCFVPDVLPVWQEAFRVLKPGGALLAGLVNPLLYALGDDDSLTVQHRIPFSDLEHLGLEEQGGQFAAGRALEFGHSLTQLVGGQLQAGFVLTDFYEDAFPGKAIDAFIPVLFATRAVKLGV